MITSIVQSINLRQRVLRVGTLVGSVGKGELCDRCLKSFVR